jgi:hypothetical protein
MHPLTMGDVAMDRVGRMRRDATFAAEMRLREVRRKREFGLAGPDLRVAALPARARIRKRPLIALSTAIVVIIGLAAIGFIGHLGGVLAAGIFTPVTYSSQSQSAAPAGAVVRSIAVSLPRVLTPSLL